MASVLGAGPRRARKADILFDHEAKVEYAKKEEDQENHAEGEFDSGAPIRIATD
jgi:hypothetical protein